MSLTSLKSSKFNINYSNHTATQKNHLTKRHCFLFLCSPDFSVRNSFLFVYNTFRAEFVLYF